MTRLHSFGVTLAATLAIWFALMIGAIVTVKSLSDLGQITLLGGIVVFALLLGLALLVDAYLWVRWLRHHRRRA